LIFVSSLRETTNGTAETLRTGETGEQLPARPHGSGSQTNETVDGLDASTEALRHAAEDTPTGTGPGKVEKTPVFRADPAPII
jgi:hypothetical protein